MRFTQEVNIYAEGATLKRFQALETDFRIQEGKISTLITESEIKELQNGNKTMYSRLASAEQTVRGLEQKYTDVSSKYDSVSGQYTSLNSQVAEYKQSVDGFSASLAKLSNSVRDNYSTTSAMETYVHARVGELETKVSDTYVTTGTYAKGIQDAKKYSDDAIVKFENETLTPTVEKMETSIRQKADEINLSVAESAYEDYCVNGSFSSAASGWSTSSDVRITEKDGIYRAILKSASYVSQTVTRDSAAKTKTKVRLRTATNNPGAGWLKVKINNATIGEINDLETEYKYYEFSIEISAKTVTVRIEAGSYTGAEPYEIYLTDIMILEPYSSYAASQFKVLSDSVSSKVEKNGIISSINQSPEKISIKASKIDFDGLVTANSYFVINTDGTFDARNGKIGGWRVRNNLLRASYGAGNIELFAGGTYDDGSGVSIEDTEPFFRFNGVDIKSRGKALAIEKGLWLYTGGDDDDFSDGTSDFRVYGLTATTGKTLGIAKDYHVGTIASSSKRYKIPEGTTTAEDANKILDIPVVQFRYKEGYLHKKDELYNESIPGFYAEEVESIIPKAVIHDESGRAEDWNYRILFPLAVKLLQNMNARIETLERKGE